MITKLTRAKLLTQSSRLKHEVIFTIDTQQRAFALYDVTAHTILRHDMRSIAQAWTETRSQIQKTGYQTPNRRDYTWILWATHNSFHRILKVQKALTWIYIWLLRKLAALGWGVCPSFSIQKMFGMCINEDNLSVGFKHRTWEMKFIRSNNRHNLSTAYVANYLAHRKSHYSIIQA